MIQHIMPEGTCVIARLQGPYLNGHKHSGAIDASVNFGYIVARHTRHGDRYARIGDCTMYGAPDGSTLLVHANEHRAIAVNCQSPHETERMLKLIKEL